MLFVVFLWLIGEGGDWFFNTGVGAVVALVLGLGLISYGFGWLLIAPPLLLVLELREEDRDPVAVFAWSAVLPPWFVAWFVPVPADWLWLPALVFVVSLCAVFVFVESRHAGRQRAT